MTKNTTQEVAAAAESLLFDDWFDAIEEATPSVVGVRHGHRERTLTGTFDKTRIAVPRARLPARMERRANGGAVRCAPTSAEPERPTP